MGNSSPPVVTSRLCSLGGSSRLYRQPGRVVPLPLPSASILLFSISPSCTESPDLSVALSLACQWDTNISATFPVFTSSMGNTFSFVTMNGPYLKAEQGPHTCVFIPSQHTMADLLYTDTSENVNYLFVIDPSLLWSYSIIWAERQGWYAFKAVY